MKQTLIKITDDHYVIVDDSKIKEGDYVLSKLNEIVVFGKKYTPSLYEKITHSTNIDWNEVYYIPLSEVKELIGEVDKFELFLDREIELGLSAKDIIERIKWYYQTYFKEDNKDKKYTEEDLKRAFEAGHKKGFSGYPNTENWKELPFEKYIQSLQPKTQWEITFDEQGKLRLV